MTKTDLYRLPTLGRSGARAAIGRILIGYGLILAAFSWILGQVAAHRLGYLDFLGHPLLVIPKESRGVLVALAVVATVGTVLSLALPAWRRLAIPNAMIAGTTGALSLGPLYAPWDLPLLTNPARPIDDTLEVMLATNHPIVTGVAQAILDKSPNERSGVISTALSFLELYRDPIVARNTEASDFKIEDLVDDERPVSLYLTVPPSDLSRTRPLVRMILNQALRRLTESMNFEDGRSQGSGRHKLLLMLDEFPALGRLAFFQESLAYLAGYGIRAFLITQDLSQHYGAYTREESITGNCHIRIAFTANKPETAELLSKMAGEMTVHLEQRSWQGHGFGTRSTISAQQTRRRLLTADEAMRLPDDDALIFVAGRPPIRASKIRYYLDRELSERARLSVPVGESIRLTHSR